MTEYTEDRTIYGYLLALRAGTIDIELVMLKIRAALNTEYQLGYEDGIGSAQEEE